MSDQLKSAVLLLQDINSINSYGPLIEKSVLQLVEDGSLDILILPKITKLNVLDQLLASVYSLATGILQRLGKPQLDVKVLFNDHYTEIEAPDWELLVLDSSSDETYDKFLYENKDTLKLQNVQRSVTGSTGIGQVQDESDESIHAVSAVGGTFDHFHDGHKILLTAAAFLTKTKLIVGITDEELLEKKKFKDFLQSYDYRAHVLLNFLKHIKPNLEIDPIAIRDVCGPTGYIEEIDSLVVSRETVSGGDFVNRTRRAKGFNELRVHVINVLGGDAEDGFQNKLSSTQLRKEQYDAFQKQNTA